MKFILTGTSNDGFRHRYSFRKNESFKKAFFGFMGALDFSEEDFKSTFIGGDENDENVDLKISEFEDCVRNYKNKKYDVDVFYGAKKIIILVRTKRRESMVKYLEKEGKWVKPIVSKKINETNKIKKKQLVQKVKSR